MNFSTRTRTSTRTSTSAPTRARAFPVLLALLLALSPAARAQEAAAEPDEPDGTPALPRSFQDLSLDMSLDDLKDGLRRQGHLFNFRGDSDVSFLPAREQTLVDTTGPSFIRRAVFQLQDGAVFIMAFTLDTTLVDHYSVYTTFTGKYGPPVSLNPREAVWDDGATRVSIERPLTVKYVNMETFKALQDEAGREDSTREYLRKEFLDAF